MLRTILISFYISSVLFSQNIIAQTKCVFDFIKIKNADIDTTKVLTSTYDVLVIRHSSRDTVLKKENIIIRIKANAEIKLSDIAKCDTNEILKKGRYILTVISRNHKSADNAVQKPATLSFTVDTSGFVEIVDTNGVRKIKQLPTLITLYAKLPTILKDNKGNDYKTYAAFIQFRVGLSEKEKMDIRKEFNVDTTNIKVYKNIDPNLEFWQLLNGYTAMELKQRLESDTTKRVTFLSYNYKGTESSEKEKEQLEKKNPKTNEILINSPIPVVVVIADTFPRNKDDTTHHGIDVSKKYTESATQLGVNCDIMHMNASWTDDFIKVIDSIAGFNINKRYIVNLSITYPASAKELLQLSIGTALSKKIYIICAVGNDSLEISLKKNYVYPACFVSDSLSPYKNIIIPVGMLNNYGDSISKLSNYASFVKVIAEGKAQREKGTSLSAPVVTAVIALLLSNARGQYIPNIYEELKKSSYFGGMAGSYIKVVIPSKD